MIPTREQLDRIAATVAEIFEPDTSSRGLSA